MIQCKILLLILLAWNLVYSLRAGQVEFGSDLARETVLHDQGKKEEEANLKILKPARNKEFRSGSNSPGRFYNSKFKMENNLVSSKEFSSWISGITPFPGIEPMKAHFGLGERDYQFMVNLIESLRPEGDFPCENSKNHCFREISKEIGKSIQIPEFHANLDLWKSGFEEGEQNIRREYSNLTQAKVDSSLLAMNQHLLKSGNPSEGDISSRLVTQLFLVTKSAFSYRLNQLETLDRTEKLQAVEEFASKLMRQSREETTLMESESYALRYGAAEFLALQSLEVLVLAHEILDQLQKLSQRVNPEQKMKIVRIIEKVGLFEPDLGNLTSNRETFLKKLLETQTGQTTKLKSLRSELDQLLPGSARKKELHASGHEKQNDRAEKKSSLDFPPFHAPRDVYSRAVEKGFNKRGCFPRDKKTELVRFSLEKEGCTQLSEKEVDEKFMIFQDVYIQMEQRRQLNTNYRSNYLDVLQGKVSLSSGSNHGPGPMMLNSENGLKYVRLQKLAIGTVRVGELGLVVRNFFDIDSENPDASYVGAVYNDETIFVKGVIFKDGELFSYHLTRGSVDPQYRREDVLPVVSKMYVSFLEKGYDLLEEVKNAREAGFDSWEYFTN